MGGGAGRCPAPLHASSISWSEAEALPWTSARHPPGAPAACCRQVCCRPPVASLLPDSAHSLPAMLSALTRPAGRPLLCSSTADGPGAQVPVRQAALLGPGQAHRIRGKKIGSSGLHRTVPDRAFRPISARTAAGYSRTSQAGHQIEREWGHRPISMWPARHSQGGGKQQ